MNQPWKNLQPKDTFVVYRNQMVSDVDKKVLSYLYQPILGVVGFSVYHLFLTMIEEQSFESREMFHGDIFNEMDIDLPAFYKGRCRLEALGLLRVYERESQGRRQFIYGLEPPLSAAAFLSDDILALLLLDKVGDRRFNRLAGEFYTPYQHIEEDYRETTHKFTEVYHFNEERLLAMPREISEGREMLPKETPLDVSIVSPSFDWSYFISLVEELKLQPHYMEGKVKDTLLILHQMYGLNELELKQAILPFIDYEKNQIDIKKLRQSLVKKYHYHAEEKPAVVDISDEQTKLREKKLKAKGLKEGEISVILASEASPPLLFLEDIKQQKNGFVTNQERYIVENLMGQSGLSESVINILIHYLLVARGQKTLATNLVNTIANDWAQSGIISPEMAIEKVKGMKSAKVGNQTSNQYPSRKSGAQKKYYQKNIRKETLPEWANKKVEETPMSAEETAFFEEELRRLRNQGKEGE